MSAVSAAIVSRQRRNLMSAVSAAIVTVLMSSQSDWVPI